MSQPVSLRPREVVAAWVDAFNRASADELAGFYATDAVNHQVAVGQVVGREAIRANFTRGLRGCGFFHIVDGKINFQRGYWDMLSFLRQHGLPLPPE